MGFFDKLFGGKKKKASQGKPKNSPLSQTPPVKRDNQADVYFIPNEAERMNWAIEKANLTLHYFESTLASPRPDQFAFSIKVKLTDGSGTEHIWLNEPHFDDDGNLFGKLGNVPFGLSGFSLGQEIGIDRGSVSDWMFIDRGRLIGGYTIRAIRDGVPREELPQFDASLGGMHIDEGEDYILAGFGTPEEAIVALEDAYDEDNIDKAIACKDFESEAKMMLTKLPEAARSPELIEKSAEVLRLTFIKMLQDQGMPKFKGVKRAFVSREEKAPGHVLVYLIHIYPDGRKALSKLNTLETENGWRVLAPES